MLAVFLVVAVILAVMWAFFRFMYPKPKQMFLPKVGEDSRPRVCDYCGQALASHRGVYEVDGVESMPTAPAKDDPHPKSQPVPKLANERFFCNYEHRAAFYNQQPLDG